MRRSCRFGLDQGRMFLQKLPIRNIQSQIKLNNKYSQRIGLTSLHSASLRGNRQLVCRATSASIQEAGGHQGKS